MMEKKQAEVVKKIHKSLNIPENYHIAPIVYQRRSRKWGDNPAPDPDPIDQVTRRKALHELCKVKIIDEPSLYPVLERMVNRLDKLMAASDRKKYIEGLDKQARAAGETGGAAAGRRGTQKTGR